VAEPDAQRQQASAATTAADAASATGWHAVDIIARSAAVSRTAISRATSAVLAPAARLLPATAGGTTIEYALLLALLTLVIIGALGNVGDALVALPLPALVAAIGG
jgi:Flp pilus assembly pilin Flp